MPGRNNWIYTHRAWRRLRAALLPDATCHWRFPGCTTRATVLDHLIDTATIPRGRIDLATDPAVVVPACHRCNSVRAGQRSARLARTRKQRTATDIR